MNAASPLADALPGVAGVAMLLVGLLLPLRQRGAAARLVAVQGGLLAAAAGSAAWGGAGRHLWLLALGALALRALALPTLLRSATGGGAFPHAAGGATSPRSGAASLLAGGGLAVLAVSVVTSAGVGVNGVAREGLALALATLLAGLLAASSRRGVLPGLVGLLAAENGALLGVVHAGGALPGALALAVLSPGLVACAALALRGRGDLLRAMPWAPRR